jgi:hypothetical protein
MTFLDGCKGYLHDLFRTSKKSREWLKQYNLHDVFGWLKKYHLHNFFRTSKKSRVWLIKYHLQDVFGRLKKYHLHNFLQWLKYAVYGRKKILFTRLFSNFEKSRVWQKKSTFVMIFFGSQINLCIVCMLDGNCTI